jgi:peptidoglycan/LPS O-acetylase OafA/YrhL
MELRRRRSSRAKRVPVDPEGGAEPLPQPGAEPLAESPGSLRGIDSLRVACSLAIAVFHSQWWLSMFLRDQEAVRTPGQWVASSLYFVVDAFFVLTGFLSARSLLSEPSSDDSWTQRFAVPLRKRFWRIMPPYTLTILVALWLFWGDRTWPRAYMRSEVNQVLSETFTPGMEWQGTSIQSWWTHLVHLSGLAPVGGFLVHAWSIGIQYLFWLWAPVLWNCLGLSRGNRVPLAFAGWTVLHAAIRWGMWSKLSQFSEPTAMCKYLHFSFYTSIFARSYAIGCGALLAWLHKRGATCPPLLHLAGGAALTAVFVANIFWEHAFGHPEQVPGWYQPWFYVLGKPGSLLSSLASSWLVWVFLSAPDPPVAVSQLAQSSYWFYLIHPVVYVLLFSRPHALLPSSSLALPVPTGYGLGVSHRDYNILNASSPLSPWSSPSIDAVTDASKQAGWIPPEQHHWLSQAKPHHTTASVSGSEFWLSTVTAIAVASLLALSLERSVEQTATAVFRRVYSSWPLLVPVIDTLVDAYNVALLVLLPLIHMGVHIVWFLSVHPDMERSSMAELQASLRPKLEAELTRQVTRHHHYVTGQH